MQKKSVEATNVIKVYTTQRDCAQSLMCSRPTYRHSCSDVQQSKNYLENNMELPTLTLAGNTVHIIPDGSRAVDTFIETYARQRSLEGDDSAFYVMNLGDVIEKYRQWVKLLPNVAPFYAIKCNNDPVLMSVLAQLGAGFDCASQQEIQQALEKLEMPVHPSRIIYAHPIKPKSYICYAAEKGVEMMTFDCTEELIKIKAHHPKAQLIVRIKPSRQIHDCSEVGEMAFKFGCSEAEAVRLLTVAEQLDIDVVGVSFYAGHRCFVPSVYDDCISTSRSVFDAAAMVCSRLQLEVLDIGGGFYGEWENAKLSFPDVATTIKSSLERHFGDLIAAGKVHLMAEPGAYIALTSSTLVVNVVGVRWLDDDGKGISLESNGSGASLDDDDVARETSNKERYNYHINDGIFGSLRFLKLQSERQSKPNTLPYRIASCPLGNSYDELQTKTSKKTYSSTIWGPTCDGADCVIEQCRLERIEVGNWLVFKDMGQYTFSLASGFCGMPVPSGCYVIEQKYVDELNLVV